MLAEPQTTSADLEFDRAGIRVRVSAWFWLAAALLGWSVCQAYSRGDQRMLLQMLVVWIGIVFLSILVHEMGHALCFSASSWPLQRNSITDFSRSPKTPRDPLFPGQVAADFVATYACGGAAAGAASGAAGERVVVVQDVEKEG